MRSVTYVTDDSIVGAIVGNHMIDLKTAKLSQETKFRLNLKKKLLQTHLNVATVRH